MLKGKKIILGISGSIAAYKAAFLTRLLVKEGAEVKVVMTPVAKEFITPLTLSTLSNKPVSIDLFEEKTGEWTNHVDLGLWADLLLIAPATANTIAKMATGQADNLLLTVFLSAKCPVMIAPAMDMDMFLHSSTQRNLKTLEDFGCRIINTGTGELASGLIGKGRMEEPEKIVDQIESFFKEKQKDLPLSGKKILVTAGPTYEIIDPVRFIGNFSTGKMGMAVADALATKGAEVHLILGPVQVLPQTSGIKIYNVVSAAEMFETCVKLFREMDGAVMAAAVSDFTPAEPAAKKTKREKADLTIKFKPTKDIAAELGKMKSSDQWLMGFALETDNEMKNAVQKIKSKNLDLIVLNSLNDPGAGFGYDTNKISIIDKLGKTDSFELKPKSEVAEDIVNKIIELNQVF